MRPRVYSWFWWVYSAGLIRLSPAFAERDTAWQQHDATVEPPTEKEMHAWLRLSDDEQAAVVLAYSGRRPQVGRLSLKGDTAL